MRTRSDCHTRSRPLLIALAIVGLTLPPWPAIGPASHAGASQSRLLSRGVPGQVSAALRSVVTWASGGQATPRGPALAAAWPGTSSPASDEDLAAPDRASDQDEAPGDVDDLAEPLVRQVVRTGRPARERSDRVRSLASWTARPNRDRAASAAVRFGLRDGMLVGRADLPTHLCRLTC